MSALKISELIGSIPSNSYFMFKGSILLQFSKNRFWVHFSRRTSLFHETGLTRICIFLLFVVIVIVVLVGWFCTISESVTMKYWHLMYSKQGDILCCSDLQSHILHCHILLRSLRLFQGKWDSDVQSRSGLQQNIHLYKWDGKKCPEALFISEDKCWLTFLPYAYII